MRARLSRSRLPVSAVLAFLPLLASASLSIGAPTSGRARHQRDLSFPERVAAQEAIERVYYSHQVGATRPFEEAAPRTLLEEKVRAYLAKSAALKTIWRTPVTAAALQRELSRIAGGTRLPDRLQEIYRALDGDAFVVGECFARPILADRLARHFYSTDERFHGAARAEAERLRGRLLAGGIKATDEAAGRRTADLDAAGLHALGDRGGLARGEVSEVLEKPEAFLVVAPLEQLGQGRVRAAIYEVPKQKWDEWWDQVRRSFDAASVKPAASEDAVLPGPAMDETRSGGQGVEAPPCGAYGTWDPRGLGGLPDPRPHHSAVWTGTEMIVWGGGDQEYQHYALAYSYDNGSRYDPLTDTWRAISQRGAPSERSGHSTVWTGREMIVWGGVDEVWFWYLFDAAIRDDGARYDPATDTWKPISRVGAPSARRQHTAVWTGSEMIVWGGYREPWNPFLGDGARYNPATDSWSAVSTTGAPSPRYEHVAVWTGEKMIIWGGDGPPRARGARYDPATDQWFPMSESGAPSGNSLHSAVWTGTEMIAWAGTATSGNTLPGGRYDPVLDRWTPVSTLNAPNWGTDHTAVWTGSRMIVWGGYNASPTGSGGIYDPNSDAWIQMSLMNAPTDRRWHTAIWTGSIMIVWGGDDASVLRPLASGGRFDPSTNTWTPTSQEDALGPRSAHTAVWTGNQMIVFGGDAFAVPVSARYDPMLQDWSPVSSVGAPIQRVFHSAVWTGTRMIVWGGVATIAGGENTGGRYDPIGDAWQPTSLTNTPSPRWSNTAVWTGSRMIVWGGERGITVTNSGGLYDPVADVWQTTPDLDAPSPRTGHTAVWTGTEMIVWGGGTETTYAGTGTPVNTGGRYNPVSNMWVATNTVGAPAARTFHVALWAGAEMLVAGAGAGGRRYRPAIDSWSEISQAGIAPIGSRATAVWTGSRMIVWGGQDYQRAGAQYDPTLDAWTLVSAAGAPHGRIWHTALWTGTDMLVWGGSYRASTVFGSGGRYLPGGGPGDADGDGVICDQDCDDADPLVRSFPGDARDLTFDADTVTLRWSPPADAGGSGGLVYDTLKFEYYDDCLEWRDGSDTTARDETAPGPGGIFFYRVRAENACTAAAGPAGFDSSGQPQFAPACPLGG